MDKHRLYRPKRGCKPFYTGFASYQAIGHGADPMEEAKKDVSGAPDLIVLVRDTGYSEEGVAVHRWHCCDLISGEYDGDTPDKAWATRVSDFNEHRWFMPGNVRKVNG